MRMRSALTATVLAAGILLGGAGAALANGGGGEGEYFSGGASRFQSDCSSAAAIPARVGPVFTQACAVEAEREHAEFGHFTGFGH
ncbi:MULTISPECIES: hypothetical protein [unclassified Streptomyces]|uniref:hypothetical protein n=1 Tax=unclassified Streptomyces TaxID=2593676 RepID=UPI00226DF509|nr:MULTISPECIES: hypothetical protein [unclassified Streptomyces]MCY0922629.1 hypothetical protein [Streptomyces sp. H27-G5]MCY0957325.1 hypothetical protein [Streptomyces sp. H27-H5]